MLCYVLCCMLCHAVVVCLQELSDQQLKQMLLAYMMLIMKGRSMKMDDLDTACEVRFGACAYMLVIDTVYALLCWQLQ